MNPLKAELRVTFEGATPEENEYCTDNAKALIEAVLAFAFRNMHLVRPFLVALAEEPPSQPELARFFGNLTPGHIAALLDAILNANEATDQAH